MKFEPQKFFIGMMEFFSILLPGALLTYLLKISFYSDSGKIEGAEQWMIFFFSSYLLGHFIFLVGSLLDDHLYDPIRQATNRQQIRRLAGGKKLSWRFTRWLARKLFKQSDDEAVSHAARIKDEYLAPHGTSSTINAFQWCKARLTLAHHEALATVQRFEADSKFFRSLLVVLCIVIVWFGVILIARASGRGDISKLAPYSWYLLTLALILVILAFCRYVDQRRKATVQAYWYLITLEGKRREVIREQLEPKKHVERAGAVVFRCNRDPQGQTLVKFLLVQAKQNPKEWVLPKGHVEAGERLEETAVREVREEAGVWGRIKRKLDLISFQLEGGEQVTVQLYLMEFEEESRRSEEGRERKWLVFEEAYDLASHLQTKRVLKSIACGNGSI